MDLTSNGGDDGLLDDEDEAAAGERLDAATEMDEVRLRPDRPTPNGVPTGCGAIGRDEDDDGGAAYKSKAAACCVLSALINSSVSSRSDMALVRTFLTNTTPR